MSTSKPKESLPQGTVHDYVRFLKRIQESQSTSYFNGTTGLQPVNSRDIHNGQPNMATNLLSENLPPAHGSTEANPDGIVEVFAPFARVNPKSGVLEPRPVQPASSVLQPTGAEGVVEHRDIRRAIAESTGIAATSGFAHTVKYTEAKAPPLVTHSALDRQIGGTHYKKYKIQPIEYIHANRIGFAEGNAIKYITRWRDKGGVADLQKAIHVLEVLIELETKTKAEAYKPMEITSG